MTALSYLLNMGGTQNKHLIKISNEIWDYLMDRKIRLTAEYISSLSNQTADWASRNFQDSSKWKLFSNKFAVIKRNHYRNCLLTQFPDYYQLSQYIAGDQTFKL